MILQRPLHGGHFANIQNALTFRILGVFQGGFLYRTTILSLDSFLICFRHFYFLCQSDDFAKAPFAWRPFLPIFKMLSFFEYQVFLERFFAYNNYIVSLDSFLICFKHFYFLSQSDDFAKAIAFACRPFCQYSKCSHFSNMRFFLEQVFAQTNYIESLDSFLISFREFYFLTQSDDFAKAIAFAWRPFLPIFKILSFFEYWLFFRAVFCIG